MYGNSMCAHILISVWQFQQVDRSFL